MVWVWLALLVLFIITEVATVQLTTIWFAGGALIAMLLSAFGVKSIVIQVIAFLAVSIILLLATRPLVKKYINKKSQPTNADRCIGEKAVVTEEINNLLGKGAAKINGVEWTARSENDENIELGTTVTVVKIDGVKLIVK
ncbi:MAG: NfeD family protein [Ruminococcaceae bacterium]|nr:NfeD family protein [Oscillospiraceae bacterium]